MGRSHGDITFYEKKKVKIKLQSAAQMKLYESIVRDQYRTLFVLFTFRSKYINLKLFALLIVCFLAKETFTK